MNGCIKKESESHHNKFNRLLNMSPSTKSMVKRFSMAQQALSQELLEARPLGICKTIGSTRISNTMTRISTNVDSKEML